MSDYGKSFADEKTLSQFFGSKVRTKRGHLDLWKSKQSKKDSAKYTTLYTKFLILTDDVTYELSTFN